MGYKRIEQLSDKQNDVAELLLRGWENKDIAKELKMGVVTVKEHMRKIRNRTNAKNCTQLALEIYYIQCLLSDE